MHMPVHCTLRAHVSHHCALFFWSYPDPFGWAAHAARSLGHIFYVVHAPAASGGRSFFVGSAGLPVFFCMFHGVVEFVVVLLFAGLRPRQQLHFVTFHDKQRRALSWIADAIK